MFKTRKKFIELISDSLDVIHRFGEQLGKLGDLLFKMDSVLNDRLEKAEGKLGSLNDLVLSVADGYGDSFIEITSANSKWNIIVDCRKHCPIKEEDARKIIFVGIEGETENRYTHVDNLTEPEKKEFEKNGFIVKAK